MPNPAPAMPTAGPIETAQSLCNRLFPHYEPDRIAASTAVSVRDAQWSARLAAVERENWTPTLIDALNSFVRENAAKFDPCKDGPSAADLIRAIHGEYNGLRSRLAEAEATRDACLSMATVGMATTGEEVEAQLASRHETIRKLSDEVKWLHARQPVSKATRNRVSLAIYGLQRSTGSTYGELADKLADLFGVRWPDKETTMEKQSLRAKLAGAIAVNGEPLSAPPPKPDLSKWPEWEAVEYRAPQISDWFVGVDCMKGQPVECLSDYYKEHDKRWILRRRTPAPEAPASDEGEVDATIQRYAAIFVANVDQRCDHRASPQKKAEVGIAAVLAAQRPKAVDVEEAAKAAQAAWVATFGDHHTWEGLGEDTRRAYRKAAAIVIRLCGRTVAEKVEEPVDIEKLRRFAQYAKKESALDDELCEMAVRAAAEIERLRGE